jgi:hypothetical protein
MQVTEFSVQEIFLAQDFRDWWRQMNSKDPIQYKLENTPEVWDTIFALYKKHHHKVIGARLHIEAEGLEAQP